MAVAAVVLAALALLAFRWHYDVALLTHRGRVARRNGQWALVVGLLAGSALCALRAAGAW
jgi:uncharacterized membrane protein